MLKIAQKSEYALALIARLAQKGPTGRLSLEEIAKDEGISQGYLEEVAGLLRGAGIIAGRRGAGGGYELTREPQAISLASIITATEGGAWLSECIANPAGAKTAASKATKAVVRQDLWRKVQGQLMAQLHGLSVADIISEKI